MSQVVKVMKSAGSISIDLFISEVGGRFSSVSVFEHTYVLMHGGLLCITFCMSVCLSVRDWSKIQTRQKVTRPNRKIELTSND